MKRKINLRLAFISLIAIVAVAAGVTSAYYRLFLQQVRRDLRTTAELLADTGRFQEVYTGAAGPEALDGLRSEELRITWIAPDGRVLFDNGMDETGLSNHLDRPEVESAFEAGRGESVRRSDSMNRNNFYYAQLLSDGTVLRVSMQAHTIAGLFLEVMPVVLGIAIAVLVLCILLSHMLTRSILQPIEQMAEYLDEGSPDLLQGRIRTGRKRPDQAADDLSTDPDAVVEAYDMGMNGVYSELMPFAEKIRTQHENILEAAKVRQDFTANVTHELKTPLTAISGYAELIENHLTEPGQEEHIARQIRSNAERLLSLINDIIRLSELDHPELARQMEPLDLCEAARKCCENQQIAAEQKGVALRCEGDGVPVVVTADRTLLNELMDNLIRNAIQYNKEGGEVRVCAGMEQGRPLFRVSDTGIGIPRDQQERVFERFYRVDKSRSRELGGTGLGLAIVKHIAQIHGAEIDLESQMGVGTKVTVRF